MFDYARSDTHFLLYIYDCMRNELIARSNLDETQENLTLEVLQRSRETAAQRYEHSVYDKTRGLGRGGWFGLIHKTSAKLSREQFAVFRKIHEWRDRVARLEDESPLQIMPNHTMFSVARTLPRDLPALVNILNPLSPSVRSRVTEVLGVVLKAIVEATEEPEPNETVSRISKEIGFAPQLGPSESENAESKESAARSRIEESTGNFRAASSRFWGSTLLKYNIVWHGEITMFEATPHISGRAVDQFDAGASRNNPYQTKELSTLSNTHNRTPRKSHTVLMNSALEKRKGDGTNEEDVAAGA